MQPGKVLVEWQSDGRLNIKTSLSINSSEGKQALIRVLLDAAKAINESGERLITGVGTMPTRILGGG